MGYTRESGPTLTLTFGSEEDRQRFVDAWIAHVCGDKPDPNPLRHVEAWRIGDRGAA